MFWIVLPFFGLSQSPEGSKSDSYKIAAHEDGLVPVSIPRRVHIRFLRHRRQVHRYQALLSVSSPRRVHIRFLPAPRSAGAPRKGRLNPPKGPHPITTSLGTGSTPRPWSPCLNPPKGPHPISTSGLVSLAMARSPTVSQSPEGSTSDSYFQDSYGTLMGHQSFNPPAGPHPIPTSLRHDRERDGFRVSIPRRVHIRFLPEWPTSRNASSPRCLNFPKGPHPIPAKKDLSKMVTSAQTRLNPP